MTSRDVPRLLSEYFAAHAQSFSRISPNVIVDVTRNSPRKNSSVLVLEMNHEGHGEHEEDGAKMTRNTLVTFVFFFYELAGRRSLIGRGRRLRWLRTRTHRQVACAQFFHIRQFVQVTQSEMVEEKFSRFVGQWTSGNFGASGNFDETAFH